MTLFTFLDLCEGKRPKKKKKRLSICFVFCFVLFCFFLDKLVLFYYELVILGPYLEALSFYGKKI